MANDTTSFIDDLMPKLASVSEQIHARPELAYAEHFAHDLLTDQLSNAGLDVIPHAFGTDTGFVCDVGRDADPCVAVILEYDALPGIGHGCGHNLIAAAGLGAGLALAEVAEEIGVRLRILGTPAEEGGGGKIVMARHGAFDHVQLAMMIHPADRDLVRMNTIAIQELRAKYRGRAAHAASAPHEGRNALDAAVLGYNAIAALRQHIRDTERVHGVFTHGGDKPNIVPEVAETLWYVRSDNLETLDPLRDRVSRCIQGSAYACECEVDIQWADFAYADMVENVPLINRYGDLARRLGRDAVEPNSEARVVGSTDMANVSHMVPSIHPMLAICEPGTPLHTADFASAATGDRANQAIRDGAVLMTELAKAFGSDASFRGSVLSAHTPPNDLGRILHAR